MFVISGDVFYSLSFYLKTLKTMSHFGWGERVVVDILKKKLFFLFHKLFAKLLLLGWQSKMSYFVKMTLETHLSKHF